MDYYTHDLDEYSRDEIDCELEYISTAARSIAHRWVMGEREDVGPLVGAINALLNAHQNAFYANIVEDEYCELADELLEDVWKVDSPHAQTQFNLIPPGYVCIDASSRAMVSDIYGAQYCIKCCR